MPHSLLKLILVTILTTTLVPVPTQASNNYGWNDLEVALAAEQNNNYSSAVKSFNNAVHTAKAEINHDDLHIDDLAKAYMLLGLSHFGVSRSVLHKPTLDERDKEFIYNELLRSQRSFSRVLYLQYKDISKQQKQHPIWRGRTSRTHKLQATVYLYLGRTEEAREEIDSALKIDPKYSGAKELLYYLNTDIEADILHTKKVVKNNYSQRGERVVEYAIEIGKLFLGKHFTIIKMLAEDVSSLSSSN